MNVVRSLLIAACVVTPFAALAEVRSVEFEADGLDMPISDNGGPVLDFAFELPDRGLIYSVVVELQVTHTYIGDLIIKLQNPEGETVFLHNRVGGGTDNIDATFDGTNTVFDAIIGKPITGTWHLLIDDEAGGDVGSLNSLKLTIERI